MLILIAAVASSCDVGPVLKSHPTVVEYCERCGDAAPGVPHDAYGPPTDIASTYVKTSETRFENLALLAGCAIDVDVPNLRVVAETPLGVLIVPDDAPAAPPPAPVDPPAAYVAPPAPVMIFTEQSTPWWRFTLAGAGGGLIAAYAISRRRRRLHEPRAVKLG